MVSTRSKTKALKETSLEKEKEKGNKRKSETTEKVSKKAKKTVKEVAEVEEQVEEVEVPSPKKKKSAKKAASPKKAAAKKGAATKKVPTVASVPPIVARFPPTPDVWEAKLPTLSYGIYVDSDFVYAGSEDGVVQQFNKDGKVLKQYRLPQGVKCIVGDGPFLYVGCNDGSLYDITQGVPRLMAKVEEFNQVYWIDVHQGLIAASDSRGKVALVNSEGETIWVHQDNTAGWMCRMDDTGVYHGHSKGVTKRNLEKGEEIWRNAKPGYVLFGQQDKDHVYCSNNDDKIYKLDKATGAEVQVFNGGGASCGISGDSKLVIAASPFTVFKDDGSTLSDFNSNSTTFMSMATFGEFEAYTVEKTLIKYDFSPEACEKAKFSNWGSQSFSVQSVAEILPETSVAETIDSTGGILCECVREDGKLRVRVISPGYNSSWNVQFPRAIREEGAKYVVEKIITQGSFYRSWGDIKKVKQ